MARPTKHYGMWRIRWVDENRNRHSEVHEKREDALLRLKEHELRVAEIKRGRRFPDPPPKFFEEIVEYWQKTRASKRSAGSGPCRSRIPEHADHRFRSKPITDSGASRSLNA